MITLLGIPLLVLLIVFQIAVVSRLNLAYGSADLVMVFLIAWALQQRAKGTMWWALFAGTVLSMVSAVPLFAPLVGYVLVCLAAMYLRDRLWNIPLITMVLITFLGTLVTLGISYAAISVSQAFLPFGESISNIILPSAAMNMLLSIPVFLLVKDLAGWLYPNREE